MYLKLVSPSDASSAPLSQGASTPVETRCIFHEWIMNEWKAEMRATMCPLREAKSSSAPGRPWLYFVPSPKMPVILLLVHLYQNSFFLEPAGISPYSLQQRCPKSQPEDGAHWHTVEANMIIRPSSGKKHHRKEVCLPWYHLSLLHPIWNGNAQRNLVPKFNPLINWPLTPPGGDTETCGNKTIQVEIKRCQIYFSKRHVKDKLPVIKINSH